ncbi:MAG TPA: dipeptidase [Solirubrobacteraceae bacterium]|nr:dipeptidase [Solirubrobacteraceae bacterium]
MPPVFDGHNDALTREDYAGIATGRPRGHLDLPRMRAGDVRGAVFAIFTPADDADDDWEPVPRDDGVLEFAYAEPISHQRAAAHATAAAGRLLGLERAGAVRVARDITEIDVAFTDGGDGGPPVAVLHLEGAEAIDPELEALDQWYAAGLRSLGPVWSRPNVFGHGVPFVSPSSPDLGPGLSVPGRRLVARCSELGILIDLSHLNEAGFWEVAKLELGPLVASHAGAHALCPASRNLTDRQLDAIAASNGLVGIVFASPFLRRDFADTEDTPASLIADHARYVADRVGVEHVALGSDFDGATIPAAVGDVAGMPVVLDALRAVGFSEHELESIGWRNWRRVLAAWWDG